MEKELEVIMEVDNVPQTSIEEFENGKGDE